MIVIACVDDDMGVMFNKRRQSQDSLLRKRIVDLTEGSTLWMSLYSGKQFTSLAAPQIRTEEGFLDMAAPGEYCFVEDADILPYAEQIEKMILYKWNRRYPADRRFPISLEEEWQLIQSEDFVGSSHEKITEEVYMR